MKFELFSAYKIVKSSIERLSSLVINLVQHENFNSNANSVKIMLKRKL